MPTVNTTAAKMPHPRGALRKDVPGTTRSNFQYGLKNHYDTLETGKKIPSTLIAGRLRNGNWINEKQNGQMPGLQQYLQKSWTISLCIVYL